jgi:hypothetical protein
MTDIDIVPKHRSRTWLWVLLAIVVLAVLWLMMSRGTTPTTGLLAPTPAESTPAAVHVLASLS